MLFINDIVLTRFIPKEMNGRLENWRKSLDNKRLRVGRD